MRRWAPWAVIALGAVFGLVYSPTGDVDEFVLSNALGLFFAAIIIRTIHAAIHRPEQRRSFIALAVGLTLWGTGSLVLATSSIVQNVKFPGPGEWFFISAYVAFAGFLFLDASNGKRLVSTSWADAVIVCGVAAATATLVLTTPLVSDYEDNGLGLFLASIYILINLALATVVLGQMVIGGRPANRRTFMLIGAFGLLALAESSLTISASSGHYSFPLVIDLAWAIGFGLLVDAACQPRGTWVDNSRAMPAWILVGAFALSVVLLLVKPEGFIGLIVGIAATATLAGAAVRLVLALRESRRAADAFKQAAEALNLAATDDLTELPNRRALFTKLNNAIDSGTPVGVLLLDIDEFKQVNDSLGHVAGDELLRQTGTRLKERLGDQGVVYRPGGDEFVVVTVNPDEIGLFELGRGLANAVKIPVNVDGTNVVLRVSIGATIVHDTDTVAEDVIRRADVAMYEAKETRTQIRAYDPSHDEYSVHKLRLAEELRHALENGHIVNWYQPKVCAYTGEVLSVEALVRWNHPTEGVVAPAMFLTLARTEGLMLNLSMQVAEQAIVQMAAWNAGSTPVGMAVNVSPRELLDGELLTFIMELLSKHNVPAEMLTLEVTEDTFLDNPQQAREVLAHIRDLGLHTSIDDYGTGFSSLAYIRDLPITELKLDRSFIAPICTDERSATIVASTVTLAHALDLRVVAEGVENDLIADKARELGIDLLQGYGIAKPMTSEMTTEWIAGRMWQQPA